jgi:glycosyltransferase involved in cell wall biosynthesis
MERSAMERCKLAIYSSEWAAKSAIDYYKTDPNKVKVVPFGANISIHKTFSEVKELINSRPSDKCKLLFLGVDWFRKGGDVALKVAEELNNSGLDTQLTIVGSQPTFNYSIPDFVKPLGFINKSNQEGQTQISQLLMESHFLILPTLADCTPIVFCEANSLGVPCLSNNVGGVSTLICNGLNGHLFPSKDNISDYCDYITNIFSNYISYKDLALSSYYEYESRLNWAVSGQKIKNLLISCI